MNPFRVFRARPHQTHLSAQNIPELRQFGDAQPPQRVLKTGVTFRVALHVEPQHGELESTPPNTPFPTEKRFRSRARRMAAHIDTRWQSDQQ